MFSSIIYVVLTAPSGSLSAAQRQAIERESSVARKADRATSTLFGSPKTAAAEKFAGPADEATVRARQVSIRFDMLDGVAEQRANTIALNLFDDVDVAGVATGESSPDCRNNASEANAHVATVAQFRPSVRPEDCNDNGTSWTHPYADLQDALDRADEMDGRGPDIFVAEGTYTPSELTDPSDARSATFLLTSHKYAICGGCRPRCIDGEDDGNACWDGYALLRVYALSLETPGPTQPC